MNLAERISYLLTIMGFLTGCAAPVVYPTQPVIFPNISATTPPAATNISTSLSVTMTVNTNTPTLQAPSEVTLEGECMALEEVPNDLHLSGVWIRQKANPYLENLEDHTKYSVPLKGGAALDDLAVSADGKLLAYLDRYVNPSGNGTDKWEFQVLKPNGHQMVLPNWVFDVRGLVGWASNQEVVLKIYEKELKYVVYNVFTGEWRVIPIDLKVFNASDIERIVSPFRTGSFFNPNQILFMTSNGNFLYNLQPWRKLLDFNLGYAADYSWSPDLSSLLVTPEIDNEQKNLYVVVDNKILLQLNADRTGLASYDYEWIRGSYWSPNSRKFIAASFSKLAIMDLETLTLRRLCIQNNPDLEMSYTYVWSPDSRYLVLHHSGYSPSGEYETYDILIDTSTMRAFKMPHQDRDDYLLGWLISP